MEEVTKEMVEFARIESNRLYKLTLEKKELYLTAKDVYEDTKKDYDAAKEQFERLDYQLALTDGRLKKVTSATKVKEHPLTIEQILMIAAKLGIKIDNEEGDD